VLAKIVPVMIASGACPAAVIRRWLAETKDKALAVKATEAAIAVGDEELIWFALRHDRGDARRAALDYLAPRLPDPLPVELLGLVTDPGSRVRRTRVSALSARRIVAIFGRSRSMISEAVGALSSRGFRAMKNRAVFPVWAKPSPPVVAVHEANPATPGSLRITSPICCCSRIISCGETSCAASAEPQIIPVS
jgi:hypothetical protein